MLCLVNALLKYFPIMPATLPIATGVPVFESIRHYGKHFDMFCMDQRWCSPVAETYVMYGEAV
jgi:hypothetical protein